MRLGEVAGEGRRRGDSCIQRIGRGLAPQQRGWSHGRGAATGPDVHALQMPSVPGIGGFAGGDR